MKERHSSENSIESKPGNVQEMKEGKKKKEKGRGRGKKKISKEGTCFIQSIYISV